MTKLSEADMTDADNEPKAESFLRSELRELGALFVGMFSAGVLYGLSKAHLDHGGGTPSALMIAVGVLMIVGILWSIRFIYRNYKSRWADKTGLSRKEQLNRKIMIACGALGGLIGITLAVIGLTRLKLDKDAGMTENISSGFGVVLNNGAISPIVALILSFIWLIIMPVISWYWWKNVVDEQEVSAYKDGALWSGTFYLFAAPAWWMLFKGGFLPEPNGIGLFSAFTLIWLIVWGWKKYR